MIRFLTCMALAAGAWLAMPAPAEAAQSYDNCTGFISSVPATISTQGTWCLDKDLSTAMTSGNAITIATNNVTLDCNHFKIGGLAAGAGTSAFGVYAESRLNATVRNCNIRGFYFGVFLSAGGGHLVEDSSFDGNTVSGLYVHSPGSTIRNNLVIDTGGSTAYTLVAFGIVADAGTNVLDNTVNGVAPTGTNANALGIDSISTGNGSINGNRISGLAPTGAGVPVGIYNVSGGNVVISDNHVLGPGVRVTGGRGIACSSNTDTAFFNVVAGFETGITTCLTSLNLVNTN